VVLANPDALKGRPREGRPGVDGAELDPGGAIIMAGSGMCTAG
jgi:hypothetical protein